MKSESVGAYVALMVATTIASISLVAYGLLENQSEGFIYASWAQQRNLCTQLAETLKVERDVIKETMALYRAELDKAKDVKEDMEDMSDDLAASQRIIRRLNLSMAYAKVWNDALKKQLVDAGIKPAKVPPYVILNLKGEENAGRENGGDDTTKGVPSACASLSGK